MTGVSRAVVARYIRASENRIARRVLQESAQNGDVEAKALLDAAEEFKRYGTAKSGDPNWWKDVNSLAGVITKSENLLAVSWKNNIKGFLSKTDAQTFWNNTSKAFSHYIDGDFYLKFDEVSGNILFANHKTGQILGFYEGVINSSIISQKGGLQNILGKLKIYHGVSGSPSYVVANISSGARIIANPNKTATIVGNYTRYGYSVGDMKTLAAEELLGNLKTVQIGPKQGGFNVLNVSDDMIAANGGYSNFWTIFNEPWLNAAIARGDDIWAASNPLNLDLIFRSMDDVPVNSLKTSEDLAMYLKSLDDAQILKVLTGFGKEIQVLSKSGYVFDDVTKMFKMITVFGDAINSVFKNINHLSTSVIAKIKVHNWTDDILTKLNQDLNDVTLFQSLNSSPELVDSWKVLKDASVGDAIRKNVDDLTAVDEFIKAKGINPDVLKNELRALTSHQDEFLKGLKLSNNRTDLSLVPKIKMKNVNIDTDGTLTGRYLNGVLEVNGNTQVAGKWDYVVKSNGEILVGRKHSFMSQGEDVLAAGELKFSNGKLVDINNLSGHYLPSPGEGFNFLRIFKKQGVNVDDASLSIYEGSGNVFRQVPPLSKFRKLYE